MAAFDMTGSGTIGRPPKGNIAKETEDERRLSEYVFMSNSIPWWAAIGGYLVFVAIGTGTIPQLYPPAKWYAPQRLPILTFATHLIYMLYMCTMCSAMLCACEGMRRTGYVSRLL